MCITNVQYVAYNALYTKHIEMQIKTAFFLKHIGSTLVMYIVEVHENVHLQCAHKVHLTVMLTCFVI
jgi:hypothetical protein